ncbi:MAG TPA: IS4 family transposase [Fibrobacteria bacterium]|nr:IS4 family transposase [Fibrobacteria bacterium]
MATDSGQEEGIEGEYEGASLGDARLGRRLVRIALQAVAGPQESFPTTAGSDSELEGTYRFLSNPKVTAEEILAPHVRQTVRRAAKVVGDVVVAHDTTEFNFGQTGRQDLGRVGQGKSFGFYGHFALAVSRDEERRGLGVVGLAVHARDGKKGVRNNTKKQTDPNNEGLRWGRSVAQVAVTLPKAIHVMDREADSYALMAELAQAGRRFVIRMAQATRKLTEGDALRIGDVLARAKTLASREVPVCARKASKMPSYRKYHPPRSARQAELEVSGKTVVLVRPGSASLCQVKELSINVVRVFEPHPPSGEPAVEWRLWTTEPVGTPEQVLAVVDAYRCRWVIEEYFKALKTGCAIEKRQLESTHALVNAVAVFAPIAWRLLLLRTLARRKPAVPATEVLTQSQLVCLRFLLRRRKRPDLPPNPTIADALLGIAAVGGHLKRNGEPGWAVIGRGYDQLLVMELGYDAAMQQTSDR